MTKKQLIMEKALKLFAEKGFESTSVQQITDECGISKGAFYLSFKSKDELISSLIDYFMTQLISDIDHAVNDTKSDEDLLYKFYYTLFHTFHRHSGFAKILIKEQMRSFNEEFIMKGRTYDQLMDKITLAMIERLYGEAIEHTKYDLIFCVKGLMKTYAQLSLFYNVSLDLDLLSKSLAEKTDLLARHITVPFISDELLYLCYPPSKEDITKEKILGILEQSINEVEEPIEKESLLLLKQQLFEPTLGRAIVKGLLENIRSHPRCKRISYLLRNHFKI